MSKKRNQNKEEIGSEFGVFSPIHETESKEAIHRLLKKKRNSKKENERDLPKKSTKSEKRS
ncbi:hypothetical protein [Alkalicoccobacillus plakortidis]|uniref:Uncharacterized protein n=1 Tax=Alkalicoccobacillus plakortidis TaxID=444060 RepID=A0ABT0XFT2_9BACI|nr:hypothetical protein [Alkalicoccobacillus plakortidis]MCM2674753.1 hypothetical protein [Alkalicoccobacillus plakortidis]